MKEWAIIVIVIIIIFAILALIYMTFFCDWERFIQWFSLQMAFADATEDGSNDDILAQVLATPIHMRIIDIEPSRWPLAEQADLDKFARVNELVTVARVAPIEPTQPLLNKCTLVTRGIYLSTTRNASDTTTLASLGVTHVLDCSCNNPVGIKAFFKQHNLKFKGLPLVDDGNANILAYLEVASKFISRAIQRRPDRLFGKGAVVVHCASGANLSPTIVAGFLMLAKSVPLEQAVRDVLQSSLARLNGKFLKQLVQLDAHLRQRPDSNLMIA